MSEPPFLVLGLGNPGQGFAGTRHNAGAMAVAHICGRCRGNFRPDHDLRSDLSEVFLGGAGTLLSRPHSFMNRSGEVASRLLARFGVPEGRFLVIADDIDLPLGAIRLRPQGSSGGHRGLESISQSIGSESFPRLRIGVGRPREGETVTDHVLSGFAEEESALMDSVVRRVYDQVLALRTEGMEVAMSRYNGRIEDRPRQER